MSVETHTHPVLHSLQSDLDELRAGMARLAMFREDVGCADPTVRDRLRAVVDVLGIYMLDVRRVLDRDHVARLREYALDADIGVLEVTASRITDSFRATDTLVAEWLSLHRVSRRTVLSPEPLYVLVCHLGARLDALADDEPALVEFEAMLTRPLALIRAEISQVTSHQVALDRICGVVAATQG